MKKTLMDAFLQCRAALRIITEADKPLEATSSNDWRRRVKLLSGKTLSETSFISNDGLVRYCFECGHVGEVGLNSRDCCPDGNHAVYVPPAVAEQAKIGFKEQLNSFRGEAQDKDVTHG